MNFLAQRSASVFKLLNNLANHRFCRSITQLGQSKSRSEFKLLRKCLKQSLQDESPNYFSILKETQVNPLPILVSSAQLEEYKSIQETIHACMVQIVSNHQDFDIRSKFNFPDHIREILELYNGKKYEPIGTYR
jgi:hypothetical protein